INIFTGLFLEAPLSVEHPGGQVQFVYQVTWSVTVLFLVCGAVLIHMFIIMLRGYKTDEIRKRQLTPILIGIVGVFLG
ncbi:hypothetical protein LH384_34815, partial [Pseudomonas aeruginosa]|nr:hypothetical protein [Pseudomonas aeruginosa]